MEFKSRSALMQHVANSSILTAFRTTNCFAGKVVEIKSLLYAPGIHVRRVKIQTIRLCCCRVPGASIRTMWDVFPTKIPRALNLVDPL